MILYGGREGDRADSFITISSVKNTIHSTPFLFPRQQSTSSPCYKAFLNVAKIWMAENQSRESVAQGDTLMRAGMTRSGMATSQIPGLIIIPFTTVHRILTTHWITKTIRSHSQWRLTRWLSRGSFSIPWPACYGKSGFCST